MNQLITKALPLTKRWWWLVVAMLATLCVALQAQLHGIIISGDTVFHFTRFYDTYEQIITGKFNYFQLNFGFYQSGRIINTVYGPLFAYLAGGLLALTKRYLVFQLLSSFLCYFIAGIGMYLLAAKQNATLPVRYFLTVIYMNMGWVPRWQLATNTSAWGAAFAPFIVMVALRMVQNKQRPIVWWQLALVMGIIIQIHVLSAVLFAVCLVPFAIAGVILCNNKGQMIIQGCLALLASLILSANFLMPYYELTKTNAIASPNPQTLSNGILTIAHNNNFNQAAILIGVFLLFGIQLGLMLTSNSLSNWLTTIIGIFALCVTTAAFPWELIQIKFPGLVHTFQFPSRILVVAYPLLLAGIALSSQHLTGRKHLLLGTVCGLVALECFSANWSSIRYFARNQIATSAYGQYKHFGNASTIVTAYHSSDLGKVYRLAIKESPDYLPMVNVVATNSTVSRIVRLTETKTVILPTLKNHHFQKSVTKNGTLVVEWTAKKAGKIQVPVNTYANSIVTLNGKKITNYPKNYVGVPTITQQQGKNTLTVNYQPWKLTTISIWISMLAWLGVFVTAVVSLGLRLFKKLR